MSPYEISAVFVGFILIAVHAAAWITDKGIRLQDSPSKLAMLLSAVLTIPHYFIVCFKPEESMIYSQYGDGIIDMLPGFGILYSIAILAMIFGISVSVNRKSGPIAFFSKLEINYYVAAGLCFIMYIVGMYLIFQKSGGFFSQSDAFRYNSELQEGTGIFNIIKVPAAYLSILLISYKYAKTGKPNILFLILFVLLLSGIELTLGSRRGPIQMILFSIVCIVMVKPDARWISLSNVLLALFISFIFTYILILRESSYNNTAEYSIFSFLVNFSYNDIYIFVMDHFSKNDLWYGKVFLDFQYRIFPLSQTLPPPSLDEGVYVYNLFLGYPVQPPLPVDLMAHNSWPPRTFGNGFMNFGVLGVMVFFFVQGLITGKCFTLARRSGFHPVPLFIYLLVIFSFQISNLKLTEMMIVMVGLFIMCAPIYFIAKLINTRSAA